MYHTPTGEVELCSAFSARFDNALINEKSYIDKTNNRLDGTSINNQVQYNNVRNASNNSNIFNNNMANQEQNEQYYMQNGYSSKVRNSNALVGQAVDDTSECTEVSSGFSRHAAPESGGIAPVSLPHMTQQQQDSHDHSLTIVNNGKVT